MIIFIKKTMYLIKIIKFSNSLAIKYKIQIVKIHQLNVIVVILQQAKKINFCLKKKK